MLRGGEKEVRAGIERLAGKQAGKRVSEQASSRALVRRLASCMEAENRAMHETVILVRR